MEDAAIHQVDIGEGNALFAVFDGHGGKIFLKQALKLVSMLKEYLSLIYLNLNFIKINNIKKLYSKLLKKLMK